MKAAIAIAVIFCAGLIGLAAYFAVHQDSGGPRTIPISADYTKRVDAGFWAMGSTTPKVTLLEYGDFQCPGCGAMYPVIKDAVEKTKDVVQFQFRNYPLTSIHNKAQVSSRAAEAAGRQGKYWEMHDLLYASQADWSQDTTFSFPGRLDGYAKQILLNVDQFDRDLRDTSVDDQIDKDVAAGNVINLQGTPTILINGKEVKEYMTAKYQATDDYKQHPEKYSLPHSADELAGFITLAAQGK